MQFYHKANVLAQVPVKFMEALGSVEHGFNMRTWF